MAASSFLRKIFVVATVLVVAVVPGRISLSDNYTSNCRTFVASNQSRVCPTWFVPNFEIKDRCDCGPSLKGVISRDQLSRGQLPRDQFSLNQLSRDQLYCTTRSTQFF